MVYSTSSIQPGLLCFGTPPCNDNLRQEARSSIYPAVLSFLYTHACVRIYKDVCMQATYIPGFSASLPSQILYACMHAHSVSVRPAGPTLIGCAVGVWECAVTLGTRAGVCNAYADAGMRCNFVIPPPSGGGESSYLFAGISGWFPCGEDWFLL